MKKTLIALILGCVAMLSARHIAVNLNGAKVGAASIPGWLLNRSGKSADYGKGEIIAGSAAGKKAFKMTAPANRHVAFYTMSAFAAAVGEKLIITADIKGKGTITMGYYAYGDKGRNISTGANSNKTFKLSDKKTSVKCEIPINPSKQAQLRTIRPYMSAAAGGEVVVENLKIEIK